MKLEEQDLKSLADGELWETFKKTNYYDVLEKFCFEKMKELRDNIVSASVDGRHEEARDLGQRLSGFRIFLDYMDDSIATRVETLQYAREQKEFEKQLPHRL